MAEIAPFEIVKVVAGLASLFVAASALLQNLERSRRELAVSLIYNWAKDTDWETSRSITILKDVPATVIDGIDEKRPTRIPSDHYPAVLTILRREFSETDLPPRPTEGQEEFEISREQSAFIRYLWVRWLNRLEGVLTAWLQGAAANDLMSEEFSPLVRSRKAELDLLKNVRHGLPAIDQFCRLIGESQTIRIRPRLGLFPWRR